MKNDYAVFIISHKRPEVGTLKALEKSGYTGDYFIVIDDTDPTIEEYKSRYGEHLLVFNKEEIWEGTDTIDNFKIMTCCTYPRNYCIKAAREKGYKYLVNLDDDIKMFMFRFVQGEKLASSSIKDIGKVFEEYIKFMETAQLTCSGFIMAGKLIGGRKNPLVDSCFYSRPTNCFIMKASTPYFKGTYYEDAIYAIQNNKQGYLTYALMPVVICGSPPMKNHDGGGMTAAYEEQNEFTQYFHIKVAEPTSIKLKVCNNGKVKTTFLEKFFVPKILNEEVKKK